MNEEQRILSTTGNASMAFFYIAIIFGFITTSLPFALGIFAGGLVMTVSFYLLRRSIMEALIPPYQINVAVVLVKHYLRFTASVVLISLFVVSGYIHPLGLIFGISVLPAGFLFAAFVEILLLFRREKL